MKTYAESTGNDPFDWNAFLAKDEFTKAELIKALDLAGEWVTCACGNLCNALPRHPNGAPLDRELELLGYEFSETIIATQAARSWDDFRSMIKWRDKARRILSLIENRSLELLKPLKP